MDEAEIDDDNWKLPCRWAGCPEEFDDELGWVKHVAVHIFTLKPGERTPWLGPPELDPDRQQTPVADDDQSGGEDGGEGDDDDDDERAFSEINALSSPACTPPQVELPDSPDLAEKINGPSTSAAAAFEPFGLLSPIVPERSLSHRSSGSAADVEADLVPTSPTPSILNVSQNASSNANQETSLYSQLLTSRPPPVRALTQSPPPNRFRRGVFQINPLSQTSPRSESGMSVLRAQSQSQPPASQTLRAAGSSQMNGGGMSWLNTQAYRLPETQDSYESD